MSTTMLSRRRRRSSGGFSLIELLIAISIILIILSIAVPKMNTVQMNAHEMAALRQIQTIQNGQTQYQSQFGRFATSLTELGPPASGAAGPAASNIIPENLSKGTNSGYNFVMQGGPSGYIINANPVTYNSSGRRSFFSDESYVIRENWGPEPATVQSKEIGSVSK